MSLDHTAQQLPQALGLKAETVHTLHQILFEVVGRELPQETPISQMVELLYQKLGIGIDPVHFYAGYATFAALLVAFQRLGELEITVSVQR
jgi:hypothetical protein